MHGGAEAPTQTVRGVGRVAGVVASLHGRIGSRVRGQALVAAPVLALGAGLLLAICSQEAPRPGGPASEPPSAGTAPAAGARPGIEPENAAADLNLYLDAARTAWRLVERTYQPATGLMSATPHWDYATTWDIASGIAALYSAHELDLLRDAEYDRRMRRLLATLKRAPLVDGITYNKDYATRTGVLPTRAERPLAHGWSAIDLGRFLVWLKIVAVNQPQYAQDVQAIVNRTDFGRVIQGGYLHGEQPSASQKGKRWRYLEGRIGYEQYAAIGFAVWGHRAEKALDLMANAQPMTLLGVPLYRDRRKLDRLTSEPFFLMGIELGWTPEVRELARNVLAAQEARYRQTGKLTMVSEDALSVPPYYFYYYCVFCNGKAWVIDAASPGKNFDRPRWISTKAAFGWHALFPNEYTERVLTELRKARSDEGWHSGLYEESLVPTGVTDINTAAVILEAALYKLQGRPLIGPTGWQAFAPGPQPAGPGE